MTFSSILADCYRRLGYQSTPTSAVVTRVKAFANETHRQLLGLPDLQRLRDDTISVATTANNARTALPKAVGKIRAIVDRTNNHKIVRVTLDELRLNDPAQAFTGGYPQLYAEVGYRQVAIQPSAADQVWVKSTSASDTGTAFLEVIRSGGSLQTLSVAMTGVTAVQVGTLTDIVEVTKFYLSAVAVGEVTLLQTTGTGTELARISIGEADARYLTIEWSPTPTSAITEYVDYTRNVLDLVNDGDVPLLPADFHWLLAFGVRMKEYELGDDTRAQSTKAEFDKGVNALRSWVLSDNDRIASLRRVIPSRPSQLGAQFPAGS